MIRYKAAIIGCGRISHKHIQAIVDNSEAILLVSACDVIKERAVARVVQYQNSEKCVSIEPVIYTDYKQMIEKEDIDIVLVCTESGYHAEISIFCMEHGKHVIVEKPIALSTNDADEMIKIANENNVKLCVSHQNRFNIPIQRLKKAIQEGRFGNIIAGTAKILWNRNENYYSQAPWRGTYALDGGCLMNQCIHNIDLLQWMMAGDIAWINGYVNNFMHDYIEAEDYGSIQIGFSNGSLGNVEGTVCTYPNNLEETLTIIGECGTVVIGGLALNKIEVWRFADDIDIEEDVKLMCDGDIDNVYGNGHTPLYKNFIEAIEANGEPLVNGEEGKIAMQIILSAYKSNREKRRLSWGNDCRELKSLDGGVM